MKKIILAITATSLCFALAACGNSNNNAAITSLAHQLDDTSNVVASTKTVNPNEIIMTKDMLEALATKNSSSYQQALYAQQSLLNEDLYKNEILTKVAKIKNGLSKNQKLTKAQTTAVKELTFNLGKYTNSVAYTKNELNNSIKSVSAMKKNVNKNAEKLDAKINRIACNVNTRAAYYQNILNTLDKLENYLCCENLENENLEKIPSADQTSNRANENFDNCNETNENEKYEIQPINQNDNASLVSEETEPQHKMLPRNIDTYGPAPHMYGYGFEYGYPYRANRFGAGYGFGNGGYGYYGGYGMGYGANGYGMNGYGMNGYGMNGFGTNGVYGFNSNNFNRAAMPATYTATSDEPRVENFEELNDDGTVRKVCDDKDCETLSVSATNKKPDPPIVAH